MNSFKFSLKFNLTSRDIDIDRIKDKPVRINALLRFNNRTIQFYNVEKIVLGKYKIQEKVSKSGKREVLQVSETWDFRAQFPKTNVSTAKIVKNLKTAETKIVEMFLAHCNSLGRFPDAEESKVLHSAISDVLKNRQPSISKAPKLSKPSNLISYMYSYIGDVIATPARRLLKGKPYKKRSVQSFLNTLNILIEFKEGNTITFKDFLLPTTVKGLPVLKFDDVNMEFYESLRLFLGSRGLGVSYFGSQIKYIKKFMNEAMIEGLHSAVEWKDKRFVKQSATADNEALTIEQLRTLREYDFSDRPVFDNARDLFLVGCWTGLRYSDYSRLNVTDHVDGDFIDILTKKTGEQVVVPILKELRKILDKYAEKRTGITADGNNAPYINENTGTWFVSAIDTQIRAIIPKKREKEGYHKDAVSGEWIIKGTPTGFPRAISDVKLNDYIKKICRIVGENSDPSFLKLKPVVKSKISGAEILELPLYDRISTHTGRRSFATNAIRLQIPKGSIMKITGHKTEAAFDAYVKIKSRENASILASHFNNFDL